MLEEQLPRALQHGGAQSVANSLWAWSTLELPIDDELQAAADAAVLRIAHSMTQKAVTQVSKAHHHGGWQLSAEALAALVAREEQLRKSRQWH